ncbi:MAG: SlyX family protein [Gammaproteobacteria bacterium]|jgi:SlyX protein|nr:SlyX family protein [Gammaproteobacteria bacterium]
MAAHDQDDLMQRIADLESQLAFQEDTIETLNQLVTQQAREFQTLQRKMQVLGEKFQQINDRQGDTPSNPADEVPPHY